MSKSNARYQRNWANANREKVNAYAARYRDRNRDKIRAADRARDPDRKRRMRYGIEGVVKAQEAVACEICGSGFVNSKDLHVDHDHKNNRVRGILCSKCNMGLGLFNDDIVLLNRALIYLAEN
jgi:hypothetical protein